MKFDALFFGTTNTQVDKYFWKAFKPNNSSCDYRAHWLLNLAGPQLMAV